MRRIAEGQGRVKAGPGIKTPQHKDEGENGSGGGMMETGFRFESNPGPGIDRRKGGDSCYPYIVRHVTRVVDFDEGRQEIGKKNTQVAEMDEEIPRPAGEFVGRGLVEKTGMEKKDRSGAEARGTEDAKIKA